VRAWFCFVLAGLAGVFYLFIQCGAFAGCGSLGVSPATRPEQSVAGLAGLAESRCSRFANNAFRRCAALRRARGAPYVCAEGAGAMNYRHEFHAGNFADVLKHVLLVRALLYLRRKDKPFRYIDTHAGAGLYDLDGPEALRSGEARFGIDLLRAATLSAPAAELIAPYLDIVGAGRLYPGSPRIAQALLRPGDRALCCELLPQAADGLKRALGRDRRAKVVEIDGHQGLNAFVPPPERRGLVLIDPPFERRDDYERAHESLAAALRKWPGGIYMIWQPVKEPEVAEAFCAAVGALAETLRIDLQAGAPARGLGRTGVLVVNPPYTLEQEAFALLPDLTRILARDDTAQFWVERLGGAKVPSQ
jgi:23S rRNA (adenine2030-N6)-methyltransferase